MSVEDIASQSSAVSFLRSYTAWCSRIYSIEVEFYFKENEKSLFDPPFLDLGVTYALDL